MGSLDKYRKGVAYPELLPIYPQNNYFFMGNAGAITIGIRNEGVVPVSIETILNAYDDTQNVVGILSVTGDFGTDPLDGIPATASQFVVIEPGLQVAVHTGITPPPPTFEFIREFVPANGGAAYLQPPEGDLLPGTSLLLNFTPSVDIDEYNVRYLIKALENA